MDDANSEQMQTPSQIIERPASVKVFGILNCVFGGLGLAFSCFSILLLAVIGIKMLSEYHALTDTSAMMGSFIYYLWNMAAIVIIFGFSVWILILGIGLVRFRKWARRGTVVFAWVSIVLGVIMVIMPFYAAWPCLTVGRLLAAIGAALSALMSLAYPVLLLIFMKTEKVKRAFTAIGG